MVLFEAAAYAAACARIASDQQPGGVRSVQISESKTVSCTAVPEPGLKPHKKCSMIFSPR